MHASSSFVTLTYSPDCLPADGSLSPAHFRDFLKRLRSMVSPRKIRFYGCGEYGDQTFRPHYHCILFGLGVDDADVIESAWNLGMVHVGELTPQSASYCAGYVTKKMTSSDDPRLNGKHPEFARMSLKPGIGATAIRLVADELMTEHGSKIIARDDDVPAVLTYGSKTFPIGRYLRQKLRETIGIPERGYEAPAVKKFVEELSVVYKEEKANSKVTRKIALVRRGQGKIDSIEAKHKIFNKKVKL